MECKGMEMKRENKWIPRPWVQSAGSSFAAVWAQFPEPEYPLPKYPNPYFPIAISEDIVKPEISSKNSGIQPRT
jgi:hypothetical protein